jgi:TonB family protein
MSIPESKVGISEYFGKQELHMLARRFRALASLMPMLLPFSVLRADVTLRYKTEVKMNPTLPAQMAATTQGLGSVQSHEIVLRLKGGKGFSESPAFSSILDFTTKEITYLDTAGKRYAKLAYGQYLDEVARATAEMPAAARAAVASTKVDVSPVRATGRTSVIQGVEVEEREVVFSLEAPAAPNMPAGPAVRMVMQLWTAKPGEVLRVPAIRELAGYSLWSYTTMNPVAGVETLMKPWPGFAAAFGPLMKELQGAHALRAHIDMFMPAITAALERLPAGSHPLGAGFDPNAPLIQMDEEVVELSSDPVPDSFFQIPEGYQEAPIADLLKGMAAKTQTASTASVSRTPREAVPVIIPEIASPRSLEDAANLVKLGRQAHEQGKSEEGDAYFRKAVEFGDSGATAYALVALGLGSFVKEKPAAANYFERAFRADSAGPMAGTALTWMARMREDDDPQTAASLYDQALGLETAPSSGRAFTLEMLAHFTAVQAALHEDKAQAAVAQEQAAVARRIRTRHVAEMYATRKADEPALRVGGGVSAPRLVSKREPHFTRAASVLRVTGTVVLLAVIDVDGSAHNIQLERGLGYGLDEAAAAALSQWRFEPGQRDGAPVPVLATIEVNFRLL